MNPTLETAAALTPANAGLRAGLKVSLWDMLKRYAIEYAASVLFFERLIATASAHQPDTEALSENDNSTFRTLLKAFIKDSGALNLWYAQAQANELQAELEAHGGDLTYRQLGRHARLLSKAFQRELTELCFLFLPADSDKFYDQDDLFGPEVSEAFKSATSNIRNAGSALAVELWDACAFHSILAMQVVFEAMAEEFQVPYSFDSWDTVIRGIKTALEQRSQTDSSESFKDKRKRYKSILQHLEIVKDATRNPIMHGKTTCRPLQAKDIYESARMFMKEAADQHIKELAKGTTDEA